MIKLHQKGNKLRHGADTTVKNKTLLKQYTYIYGWNIDDKSEAPPRNNMEFRQYEDTDRKSVV